MDLNVDIGEGFPYDEQLLEFATSANICCGEHAGSWELTLHTIEMCKRKGTRIGMHPGFPDRESMGRAAPVDDYMPALTNIIEQGKRFMGAHRATYVKPHGAWYNTLCSTTDDVDPGFYGGCAGALFGMVEGFGIAAMVLPNSPAAWALNRENIITEGFADRAYLPDGTLVPRSQPGAVLEDPEEIKAQVLRLAPEVDSICLHGDTPGCLEFAELVRKTLEDAGYEVAA